MTKRKLQHHVERVPGGWSEPLNAHIGAHERHTVTDGVVIACGAGTLEGAEKLFRERIHAYTGQRVK